MAMPPGMTQPAESAALVDAILAFLGGGDPRAVSDIRPTLEREVDAAGADALRALRARMHADSGWSYYPGDKLRTADCEPQTANC